MGKGKFSRVLHAHNNGYDKQCDKSISNSSRMHNRVFQVNESCGICTITSILMNNNSTQWEKKNSSEGELPEICTCPVRYIFDKELVIVSEIKRRKSFVQVIICYKMGLISLNYQPSTNRPHI